MLTLRGHHLLCLPRFRGKGYNRGFTENMQRIAGSLTDHPGQVVCLTDTLDDICHSCPHLQGSVCALDTGDNRVSTRDLQVLTLLGLKPGACVPYATARDQLEMLLQRALFEQTCGSCHWFELCLGLTEAHIP